MKTSLQRFHKLKVWGMRVPKPSDIFSPPPAVVKDAYVEMRIAWDHYLAVMANEAMPPVLKGPAADPAEPGGGEPDLPKPGPKHRRLTPQEKEACRRIYAQGEFTQKALALRIGIHSATMNRILTHKE